MAFKQVINLTGDASDNEVQDTSPELSNATRKSSHKLHSEFYARARSGPQQHVKRMRDYGRPRLGDDCPCLELPPEVRNRIYEHALGGHNLHMFRWSSRERRVQRPRRSYPVYTRNQYTGEPEFLDSYWLQYVLCQCPNSDDEAFNLSSQTPAQEKHGYVVIESEQPHGPSNSFKIHAYPDRHAKCLNVDTLKYNKVGMLNLPPRLATGLLRTCRQVYNEAALVPYYDNTFSFASAQDMDFFVGLVLKEKQRAALQHIQYTVEKTTNFFSPLKYRQWKRHYSDAFPLRGLRPSTIDLLTRLKTLTLTLDCLDVFGTTTSRLQDDIVRFAQPGLQVRTIFPVEAYITLQDHSGVRAYAEELEYGIVRSIEDVPTWREAREQLNRLRLEKDQAVAGSE